MHDDMMMRKRKTNKSKLGKTPGALQARTILATPVRAFVPDVSPGLANPGWRLVFIGFDNVFGIGSLLYDCLDRVTDFFYAYSALAKLEYAFVPDVRLVLTKQWPHLVLDGSYRVVFGTGFLDDCLDASPSFFTRTMRMRLLPASTSIPATRPRHRPRQPSAQRSRLPRHRHKGYHLA